MTGDHASFELPSSVTAHRHRRLTWFRLIHDANNGFMPLVIGFLIFVAVTMAVAFSRRVIVDEHRRVPVYKHGRFAGVWGPGAHWSRFGQSTGPAIDVRRTQTTIGNQDLLTSDGVGLRATVVVEYQVVDVALALNSTQNYVESLYVSAQMALRDFIASMAADELLTRRGEASAILLASVSLQAEQVGLAVHQVQIKDLMFPGELKQMFAKVAQAKREGEAALERARGEAAAMRSLTNTAKLVEANPVLLQMRLLQQMGESSGNTWMVGVSENMVKPPVGKGTNGGR